MEGYLSEIPVDKDVYIIPLLLGPQSNGTDFGLSIMSTLSDLFGFVVDLNRGVSVEFVPQG